MSVTLLSLTTAPRDPGAVRAAIGRAAGRTGADFGYLLAQAKSESGLDPTARARTSSAGGLFQFIDQSWLGVLKQHGREHGYGWAADAIERRGGRWALTGNGATRQAVMGLRADPEASSLMAGAFARDNAAGLERALGRTATSGDLYFAHFLGLAGATRFLKAREAGPDAPAAAAFPVEARANRPIFYTRAGQPRSLDEVYRLMARKVDGGSEGATVQMAGAPSRLEPPAVATGGVRLVDLPPSSAAADARMPELMEAALMRPTPATARLAYLMIAATLPSVA